MFIECKAALLADCEVEVLQSTVFRIDTFDEMLFFAFILTLSIVEYEEAHMILSCAMM